MVKKTTITYSVLWGNRGVKAGFKKPSTARAFAQIKANKLNEKVDIDKITKSEMDWSQKHYVSIFPKSNLITFFGEPININILKKGLRVLNISYRIKSNQEIVVLRINKQDAKSMASHYGVKIVK